MNWFATVEDFYKEGYYTKDQVKIFVEKSKITLEEFKEITGDEYVA